MNKKQANKDIYEFSKTLYGAERFKLVIGSLFEFQKEGKNLDEVPQIYTTFDKKDELESYKSIYLDYVALNGFVWFYLKSIFRIILLSFSLDEARLKKAKTQVDDVGFRHFFSACKTFFAGVAVINELNEKYSCELLDFYNKKEFDEFLDFLSFLDKTSFLKPKESDLTEWKKTFYTLIEEIHKIADLGSKE